VSYFKEKLSGLAVERRRPRGVRAWIGGTRLLSLCGEGLRTAGYALQLDIKALLQQTVTAIWTRVAVTSDTGGESEKTLKKE